MIVFYFCFISGCDWKASLYGWGLTSWTLYDEKNANAIKVFADKFGRGRHRGD